MMRVLFAAAVLAVPTVATAGVYVSLGIGTTGVSDSDSTMATTFQDNGRSGRIALGYRFVPLSFGSFSVEGGYQGFNVERSVNNVPSGFDGHEYFAAAKFNYPFNPLFEAFGRLGYEHSSFSSQMNIPNTGLDGNGVLAGGGVEFRLGGIASMPPVLSHSSLWVDFTYNANSMTDYRNQSRGVGVDMFAIGATFGF